MNKIAIDLTWENKSIQRNLRSESEYFGDNQLFRAVVGIIFSLIHKTKSNFNHIL